MGGDDAHGVDGKSRAQSDNVEASGCIGFEMNVVIDAAGDGSLVLAEASDKTIDCGEDRLFVVCRCDHVDASATSGME